MDLKVVVPWGRRLTKDGRRGVGELVDLSLAETELRGPHAGTGGAAVRALLRLRG